jgi:hypothetical protein
MKGSEMFTAVELSGCGRGWLSRGGLLFGRSRFHVGTNLQLVLAIINHALASFEPLIDQGFTLFNLRHLHGYDLDGIVVFDPKDIRAIGTTLDG